MGNPDGHFKDFLGMAPAQGAALVVATRSTHEFRYLSEALWLRPLQGLIVVDLQQVSDEGERRYHFPKYGHYNPMDTLRQLRSCST